MKTNHPLAKKSRLAILGINSAHEASACLLIDGHLVVAIAEERLSRIKYQAGFPYKAVKYCLYASGLTSLDDIDCVVLNQPPSMDFDLELRKNGYSGRLITNPSHHLLHAYYAWVASGFNEGAIMIVDGSGYSYGEYLRRSSPLLGKPPPYSEMEEAESLYVFHDNQIELVSKRWALWEGSEKFCRFASLGHMYSIASQYIFGHWKHAGKTMGLAPYGDPSSFPEPFVELIEPEIFIHTDWPIRLPSRSSAPAHLDPVCRDLAAKVQSELEKSMLYLAERLYRKTSQTRLCISGGVGLNSVTNGRILRELPYSELFITPAAGDSGICIGAALYGYHEMTRSVLCWCYTDDFHGRCYRESERIETFAKYSARLRIEQLENSPARAAQDIADGLIVGWMEGRSEFGPRALGHRSILCDPRTTAMRDRLNETVKYREPFRPFAASVLAEYADEYFDLNSENPFMLVVAPVFQKYRDRITGICHVDDTCRIQTVSSNYQGKFRALLESFMNLTGLPMVLNSSFNIKDEPIVETPDDALNCFLATNIDVLYIDGVRITKASVANADRPDALVPRLNNALSIVTVISSTDGRATTPEHYVKTRTGSRIPIYDQDLAFLCAVDGKRTIIEIANTVQNGSSIDPVSTFDSLQKRGFVSFEFECEDRAVK